jgi:hypothetical protein
LQEVYRYPRLTAGDSPYSKQWQRIEKIILARGRKWGDPRESDSLKLYCEDCRAFFEMLVEAIEEREEMRLPLFRAFALGNGSPAYEAELTRILLAHIVASMQWIFPIFGDIDARVWSGKAIDVNARLYYR